MPVAFTSTRTSPAFGPSSWTSMTVSGLPFSSATAARGFRAASPQPGSVTVHRNGTALLHCEREPPLLESERPVSPKPAPPNAPGRGDRFLRRAAAVAVGRLALAPSGDLDEHGKLFGLAYQRLQAFPGMLRLEAIGGRRGEHLHFLAHPIGACALFQISGELEIDIAQVCDVGDRIGELRLAERPTRPVGEAMRFVQGVSGDALHELVVRDRIAIAQHHGGDLSVDDR